MAIALVKNLGSYNSGQTAGPATWTIPVGAVGVAVGNRVIVFGGGSTATLNSVTDPRGNTYTIRRNGGSIAIWFADAIITTALQAGDLITVVRSGTGNLYMMAAEFSGVGDFVAINAATQTSTNALSSGAVSASAAGDLILGAFKALTASATSSHSSIQTPGSGFTNQVGISINADSAEGFPGHALDWQTKIAAGAGSETSTATLLNTATSIYGLTVAYKEAVTTTVVGSQRALLYNVNVPVASQRAFSFSVTTLVGSQRSIGYVVRAAVGNQRALLFKVNVAVGSMRALVYKVMKEVGAQRAFMFSFGGPTGTALEFRYKVNLTPVNSSRALVYKLLLTIGSQRALPYKMPGRVGSQRSLDYILTPIVTPITWIGLPDS